MKCNKFDVELKEATLVSTECGIILKDGKNEKIKELLSVLKVVGENKIVELLNVLEIIEDNKMEKTEDIKKCKFCGVELPEDARFCTNCGNEVLVIEKKICLKCGAELSEDANFCPKCGEKVRTSITCPNCGKELQLDAKFCSECGCNIQNPDVNLDDDGCNNYDSDDNYYEEEKSTKEKITEIVDKYINAISKSYNVVYTSSSIAENIYEKVFQNLKSKIVIGISNDDIIGFIDTTLKNTGKGGLVFTTEALYSKDVFDSFCIPYSRINTLKFKLKKTELHFTNSVAYGKGFFGDDIYIRDTCYNLSVLKDCLKEIKSVL